MNDNSVLDPARLVAAREDRRGFRRFPTLMIAFTRLAGTPPPTLTDQVPMHEILYTLQPVPVSDLSMTGLFFSSRLSYPSQAELEVHLCLNGTEFIIPSTVERRARVDNRQLGYGVNFQQGQTTKEFRLALATYLLRRDCAVK